MIGLHTLIRRKRRPLSWSREKRVKVVYTVKLEDYKSLSTTCWIATVPKDPKLERRTILKSAKVRGYRKVCIFIRAVRVCARGIVVCGFGGEFWARVELEGE